MVGTGEDTEDEFPDLMELLGHNNPRTTQSSPARQKLPRTTESKKTEPNQTKQTCSLADETPRIHTSSQNASRGHDTKPRGTNLGGNRADTKEDGVKKAKRRILGQNTKSTFLQPFDSADVNGRARGASDEKTLRRRMKDGGPQTDTSAIHEQERILANPRSGRSADFRSHEGTILLKKLPVTYKARNEPSGSGSDGMSDFIADDSSLDEASDAAREPPRSIRRLRRKASIMGESEPSRLSMSAMSLEERGNSQHRDSPKVEEGTFNVEVNKVDKIVLITDKHGPFVLIYSPPGRLLEHDDYRPTLKSPSKKHPEIPSAPHRPSMDSFWSQDMVNHWNDEYSPQKSTNMPDAKDKDSISKPRAVSPQKTSPTKPDKAMRDVKKAFNENKHAIAEGFLAELDLKIANGEISRLSASTGGVKILWSKKLNTTAGRANWKRETVKASLPQGGEPPTQIFRHHACIELAEKVIDNEDRLLNVIAHEFCHLTNFMISNVKTNPHGKEFKEWAAKCSASFKHRGIEVTTKHSYSIDYKYVWECGNCGVEFKRHSKSIDPGRHQCGSCKSKLIQTKPAPREKKPLSEYQTFVKDNMSRVRTENPDSPQKQIMGLIGKQYRVHKISKEIMETPADNPDASGERKPMAVEEIDLVARKLNFLDLTGP